MGKGKRSQIDVVTQTALRALGLEESSGLKSMHRIVDMVWN